MDEQAMLALIGTTGSEQGWMVGGTYFSGTQFFEATEGMSPRKVNSLKAEPVIRSWTWARQSTRFESPFGWTLVETNVTYKEV